METSELSGAALDWAVAKAEGYFDIDMASVRDGVVDVFYFESYKPSSDWALAGPIIEREWIDVIKPVNSVCWVATMHYQNDDSERIQTSEEQGTTPLIAAMRCYVASKLGDEIELPEALNGQV